MSEAIEVSSRTRKILNANPIIKAHLDSYCFYLENEGRGKTEAREEVSDLVDELESEFNEALLALEKQEELKGELKMVKCIKCGEKFITYKLKGDRYLPKESDE